VVERIEKFKSQNAKCKVEEVVTGKRQVRNFDPPDVWRIDFLFLIFEFTKRFLYGQHFQQPGPGPVADIQDNGRVR